MAYVNVKYSGIESTRIRKDANGDKIEILPGEIFECSSEMATLYTKQSKTFQITGEAPRAPHPEAPVEVSAKKTSKKGKKEAPVEVADDVGTPTEGGNGVPPSDEEMEADQNESQSAEDPETEVEA